MNVVVLVALLRALNTNIYGASRIAYSLVERGQGPKVVGRVSGGVPRIAVLASSVFGFLCVLLSHWRPDDVFPWLLNMIGAVILVMAREPGTRTQLYGTGGMTLFLAAVGYAWQRARATR